MSPFNHSPIQPFQYFQFTVDVVVKAFIDFTITIVDIKLNVFQYYSHMNP